MDEDDQTITVWVQFRSCRFRRRLPFDSAFPWRLALDYVFDAMLGRRVNGARWGEDVCFKTCRVEGHLDGTVLQPDSIVDRSCVIELRRLPGFMKRSAPQGLPPLGLPVPLTCTTEAGRIRELVDRTAEQYWKQRHDYELYERAQRRAESQAQQQLSKQA